MLLRAPIGPEDAASSELADYIEPDSRPFSFGHPLLETEFVGPYDAALGIVDPLLPDDWEDLVDHIPDELMHIRCPFSGTLREVGEDHFVRIWLDKIKYAAELAEPHPPFLNRISDVYLGPVDFTADFAERLAAAPRRTVRVEAGELIGDLKDRIFKLGFFGRSGKSVFWIDPATVVSELLSAGHPLIAGRSDLDRVRIAGPYETEAPGSLAMHESVGNYLALELRKDDFVCELHNPAGRLAASTFSLFSEDELTPQVVNAAGGSATQPSGAQVTLSMTRVSVAYGGTVMDDKGNVEGLSAEVIRRNPAAQNLPLTIGETVRPRDVFAADGYGANHEALTSYNLRIEHRLSSAADFVAFTLYQDATDRLREEYRDREIPVPPRHYFTTPRMLLSSFFDARELHLQHDYNAARAAFFGDDKLRHQRDLTILEDEVRAVANYVNTRYLYHLLYSDTPLIANPDKRKRMSADLRITRGFANPRKTSELGYSRVHPRQYGHFLEFKPVYRSTLRMRALRMACADFIRETEALNGAALFRHLFFQFTKRVRRRGFEDEDSDTAQDLRAFWKIELDGAGNEAGSPSVRIRDDGTLESRGFRKIRGRVINSTLDAEERTFRIELMWQPNDLLARPSIPIADPLPDTAPSESQKRTSIVLLATEASAIPAPYRLPLDDKARTFVDWLRTKYPDDNEPRLFETVTLGDALGALGLFTDNEDEDKDEVLKIRYLVIISHSTHETLLLRNFDSPGSYTGPALDLAPENDAEYVSRAGEQVMELLQLYRYRLEPVIHTSQLQYKALTELSHASKRRLREVFSGAEAILLTGCAPGYTKFTETHRLGPIASAFARITNTDVYASDAKVLSYAMKADGNWRYHGPLKNSATDLVEGPHRDDDADYPDLATPLTVVSVPIGLTDAFEADDGIHKAEPATFDTMAHHTKYLNEFLAPSKRRHPDRGPDDDAAEDTDDATDFDTEPDD